MYPPPCTHSHMGGGCPQGLHKWGLGGKRGRGNANTVGIPPPLFTPVTLGMGVGSNLDRSGAKAVLLMLI